MRVERRAVTLARLGAIAIAIAISSIAPAAAIAADAAPAAAGAVEGAKAARAEGDRLFQLGRFDQAIAAYERAFGLDPQPAFLFNIGLAHRRQFQIDGQIEHLRRARELYRNYLRLEPASRMRPGIEKIVAELDAQIEQARRSEATPGTVAPPARSAPAGEANGAAPPPFVPPPPLSPPAAPAPRRAQPPAALIAAAPPPQDERGAGRSRRAWLIAGGVVAVAAAATLAIILVSARSSGSGFDGPAVDLTPH